MKKLFILFIAATTMLAGCKKDSRKGPVIPDVVKPITTPLLFGQTRVTDSYYVTTTWEGNTRDTTIVHYKHKNMLITGFYERYVVSPNGIAKGIEYYGNEVVDGKGSRLYQFLQTSKPFTESTGRDVEPRYVEWAQGSIRYNGDNYIIALGGVPGQRAKSYYYKVDGQDGKPSFHPLAQTPNGSGYGLYCGTSKGLLVSKTLSTETKTTFLEVFREDTWIQDYKLQMPGYIYIDVQNIFAKDDDNLIVIVSAKKEGTPITGLFYVTINLVNHTVKTYQADLPEANFHINEGAYAKSTVYLPYYENGTNKCAYITLKMEPNTTKLKTEKIDLPVKNGVTYGSATLLSTNGNNVYVAGEQGGLACYWRNNKLVDINNKDATRSFITKMSIFD
jgi:hypothetical protein